MRPRLLTLAIGGLILLVTFAWQSSLEDARRETESARLEVGRLRGELADREALAAARDAATIAIIRALQADHDALLKAIQNDEPVIIRLPSKSPPDESASEPPSKKANGSSKDKKEPPPPKRRPFLVHLICLFLLFC